MSLWIFIWPAIKSGFKCDQFNTGPGSGAIPDTTPGWPSRPTGSAAGTWGATVGAGDAIVGAGGSTTGTRLLRVFGVEYSDQPFLFQCKLLK